MEAAALAGPDGRPLTWRPSASDHTVILQLPQLLNQHLLRNRRDRALEFRETQQLAIKQVKQDDELLATFKNLERLLHPFGSGPRRVASILTIR